MKTSHFLKIYLTLLALVIAGVGYWFYAASKDRPVARRDIPGKNAKSISQTTHTRTPNHDQAAETSRSGTEQTPKSQNVARIDKNLKHRYHFAIRGLHLPPSDERRLYEMLRERELAGVDAHDALTDSKSQHPGDYAKAVHAAQSVVDEEIKRAFPVETAAKISEMVRASSFIDNINSIFAPAFQASGLPLNPEQVIPLAAALRSTYTRPGNPITRPEVDMLDPKTKLTEFDQTALGLAAAILSPEQLNVFRSTLAENNQRIVKARLH